IGAGGGLVADGAVDRSEECAAGVARVGPAPLCHSAAWPERSGAGVTRGLSRRRRGLCAAAGSVRGPAGRGAVMPRDTSQWEARDWPDILEQAAAIVDSYETRVTLRQLFYRLVAAEVLPNTTAAYKGLSRHSAAARRRGEFPALLDRGRSIHRDQTFTSP